MSKSKLGTLIANIAKPWYKTPMKSNKSASPENITDRVMIQCRSVVNKSAVKRETIDGVEHIIVSSSTLPDNIVMNGGLYPSEEIESSFESLERTLAPVEHPEVKGQYLSASDPIAISDFYAGAYNANVRREDGRVHVDKIINVQEALKSDRGKRLLDRINELETSENPRPIHTSVGVFLEPEILDSPMTNSDDQEYSWIARNMVFDHDAILLDNVGAAQPHQGVGIAVNSKGEEFRVDTITLNEGESVSEIRDAVMGALEKMAIDIGYIEELYPDRVIFWSSDQMFEVDYRLDDNGIATIVSLPLPVDKVVTFNPKTNNQQGDDMKELIINALKAAGVTTDGLSDQQLFDAYGKLNANSEGDKDASVGAGTEDVSAETDIAAIVANAIAPLAETIKTLAVKVNSTEEAEVNQLATLVANSGKYPALDAESAKLLPIDKLKEMATNCKPAFGVSPIVNLGDTNNAFSVPTEMPE